MQGFTSNRTTVSTTTSSFALTASFASGIPSIKAGIVSGSLFSTGNPRFITVTFTSPFINNNYSVVVTGEASRAWIIQSKSSGSFVINSNAGQSVPGLQFWQAVYQGEYYS